MNNDIGRAIRLVRLARGLEVHELAAKAGLSNGFISNIQNGRKDPSWKSLQKIANALDVSLVMLVAISEGESDPLQNLLLVNRHIERA